MKRWRNSCGSVAWKSFPVISKVLAAARAKAVPVIYTTGAVIKDDTLFLYYGGGDKTVNVATAPLEDFLEALTHNGHAVLTAPAV